MLTYTGPRDGNWAETGTAKGMYGGAERTTLTSLQIVGNWFSIFQEGVLLLMKGKNLLYKEQYSISLKLHNLIPP